MNPHPSGNDHQELETFLSKFHKSAKSHLPHPITKMLKSVLFNDNNSVLPESYSGPTIQRTESLEFFDSDLRNTSASSYQGSMSFEPSSQLNEYDPIDDPVPLLEGYFPSQFIP